MEDNITSRLVGLFLGPPRIIPALVFANCPRRLGDHPQPASGQLRGEPRILRTSALCVSHVLFPRLQNWHDRQSVTN